MFSYRHVLACVSICQILPIKLLIILSNLNNHHTVRFWSDSPAGKKFFSTPPKNEQLQCSFFPDRPEKSWGALFTSTKNEHTEQSLQIKHLQAPHQEQFTNIMYTTRSANELYQRLTFDTFCVILTLGQLDSVCNMLHHRVYPLTRAG